MEVVAGHKADSALKAKDSDISPSNVTIFAIEIANSNFWRSFRQINLLNCAGPTF